MNVIARRESEVRSYCRTFPATFSKALGSKLWDGKGAEYLDFFSGAGSLNYGHNHPALKDALVSYISGNGIAHSLDMTTDAKCRLLEAFERIILEPRKMDYKVMFPGPTGTNSVESALKLARKVTGRSLVISFTNAFHGMTLGSLAVTGNEMKRNGAGVPLGHTFCAPFDGYFGEGVDTIAQIETMLSDGSSGLDAPAAFIVETVQAEGGINVASGSWLRELESLARKHKALLIVDDVQVGCGRTGLFFSFEEYGIQPDIICLSKSLSAFGLPLALTLFKPELDIWKPGEHNGTFRGNNHAFVTAAKALELFWSHDSLSRAVSLKAAIIEDRLRQCARRYGGEWRGRGMIQGLAFGDSSVAPAISAAAFSRGMLVETSGSQGEVLKLLPPLTIDESDLQRGLNTIDTCIDQVLSARKDSPRTTRTQEVMA
ncbi:MAG: diaminobutyrate--2-oxoglutarate transaminase [Planctomycetes bacterium]|nr:diaminobutyrate--2-oxoglutarate transaminase [Planctomycetota bacterium]NUQ34103.1 diaminobutyrate--2-oxoglutarate transaminase [Planctomycetaceae bacterium]